MIARQTIQKPHQIAACPHLLYLLFTRKSEGQRWRRMLRSASRGVSRADFRFDDRIEGTGGLICVEGHIQPGMIESPVPEPALAGITCDELVQWMVEDALIGR
jgi:hypothetical protein